MLFLSIQRRIIVQLSLSNIICFLGIKKNVASQATITYNLKWNDYNNAPAIQHMRIPASYTHFLLKKINFMQANDVPICL